MTEADANGSAQQRKGAPGTDRWQDSPSSIAVPTWLTELLPETESGTVQDEYRRFLDLNDRYLANPDDWALAYNWLSAHPLFWT